MDWDIPKFPLDDLSDDALTWLTTHGSALTRGISRIVSDWIEVLSAALVAVPPWLLIGLVAHGGSAAGSSASSLEPASPSCGTCASGSRPSRPSS